MLSFLVRRFLLAIPLLIIVSVMAFSLVHLLPGDPAMVILGPEAPKSAVAALRVRLGLDQPIYVQYLQWLGRALHGDLGRSLVDNTPVAGLIAQRLGATVELAILTVLVSTAVAVPLGIIAARSRATAIDYLSSALALGGLSVPSFWLALLLIVFFAVRLHWLPASGYVPLTQGLASNLKFMILPVLATALREAGVMARFTRSSMLEVLGADYVRTARAKGLAEPGVVLKHAMRAALIPVITASGLQIAGLLGGLVITENIFLIPGFGRLIVDSVFTRDITVIQGSVLVAAVLVVAVNLAVDIIYSLVDPRIQLSSGVSQ
ncbi:MAG: ABC transporter permease [Symbiobacteriia bacterium]